MSRSLADEREQFVDGLLRGGHQFAPLRVVRQHVAPHVHRRPARPRRIDAGGRGLEVGLRLLQFPLANGQQRAAGASINSSAQYRASTAAVPIA